MILPALLALASYAASQEPSEIVLARAFLREAHVGLDGVLLPPYREGEVPQVDDQGLARLGLRMYWFPSGMVSFDVKSGRMHGYASQGVRLPTHVLNKDGSVYPRRVSDADALVLAQRFYNAAGYPGRIVATSFQDLSGHNDVDVEVHFVRAHAGLPFRSLSQDGMMWINRETGALDSFGPPVDQPNPPPSLSPGGSLAEGRLAALRALLAWRGGAFQEDADDPIRLCLWSRTVGARHGWSNFAIARRVVSLGPGHVAALAANRAVLAYVGTLRNAAGVPFEVVLDARTGFVLEMADARLPEGVVGGAVAPPPPRPMLVPTTTRPWRVGAGGKGWKAWSAPATVTLTPVPGKPPAGARVLLTDGTLALSATYDPKTGLVGAGGRAYRPGPALAGLLKRTAERNGGTPRASKPHSP